MAGGNTPAFPVCWPDFRNPAATKSLRFPMQNVSFAVEYAWRAAAEEALQTGSEMIEPIHLLIGLCSIEKFFYLDTPLQLSGYALASIRFEWQDFANRVAAAEHHDVLIPPCFGS